MTDTLEFQVVARTEQAQAELEKVSQKLAKTGEEVKKTTSGFEDMAKSLGDISPTMKKLTTSLTQLSTSFKKMGLDGSQNGTIGRLSTSLGKLANSKAFRIGTGVAAIASLGMHLFNGMNGASQKLASFDKLNVLGSTTGNLLEDILNTLTGIMASVGGIFAFLSPDGQPNPEPTPTPDALPSGTTVLAKALEVVFTLLVAKFKDVFADIGKAMMDASAWVNKLSDDLDAALINAITGIATWCDEVNKAANKWAAETGKAIATAISDAAKSFEAFKKSANEWASGIGKQIGTWFDGAVKDASSFLSGVGAGIGTWADQVGRDIGSWFDGAVKGAGDFLGGIGASIGAWAADVGKTINGWFNQTPQGANAGPSGARDGDLPGYEYVTTPDGQRMIKGEFARDDGTVDYYARAVAMYGAENEGKTWWSKDNTYEDLYIDHGIPEERPQWVKDRIAATSNGSSKSVFDQIGDYFSTTVTAEDGKFVYQNKGADLIEDLVLTAVTGGAGKAVSTAGKALSKSGVAKTLGDVGSSVGKALGDAGNAIGKAVGDIGNSIGSAVNNVVNGIKGVFGFAEGGVFMPNSPQLAILGDNRTEPEVAAPYSMIVSAVRDALSSSSGTGQSIRIEIPVQLDGRTIARASYDYIQAESIRRNGSVGI